MATKPGCSNPLCYPLSVGQSKVTGSKPLVLQNAGVTLQKTAVPYLD